jgi:hypothetical protein
VVYREANVFDQRWRGSNGQIGYLADVPVPTGRFGAHHIRTDLEVGDVKASGRVELPQVTNLDGVVLGSSPSGPSGL